MAAAEGDAGVEAWIFASREVASLLEAAVVPSWGAADGRPPAQFAEIEDPRAIDLLSSEYMNAILSKISRDGIGPFAHDYITVKALPEGERQWITVFDRSSEPLAQLVETSVKFIQRRIYQSKAKAGCEPHIESSEDAGKSGGAASGGGGGASKSKGTAASGAGEDEVQPPIPLAHGGLCIIFHGSVTVAIKWPVVTVDQSSDAILRARDFVFESLQSAARAGTLWRDTAEQRRNGVAICFPTSEADGARLHKNIIEVDTGFETGSKAEKAELSDAMSQLQRLTNDNVVRRELGNEVWLPKKVYWMLLRVSGAVGLKLPPLHLGNVFRFVTKLTGRQDPKQLLGPSCGFSVDDADGGAHEPGEEDGRAAAGAAAGGGGAAAVDPEDLSEQSNMYVNASAIQGLYRDLLYSMCSLQTGHRVNSAGAIFHGPPGSGKTTIADALIEQAGFFVIVRKAAAELNRQYVGQTEQMLGTYMDMAEAMPEVPTVIFFDEIDTIAARRGGGAQAGSTSGKTDVLSVLLSRVGSPKLKNFTLLGTTNRKSAIDPAVMRPGRLSTTIYIGRLGTGDRLELTSRQWADMELPPEVMIDPVFQQELIKHSQNFTGALVRAVLSSLQQEFNRCGGETGWSIDRWVLQFKRASMGERAKGNDDDLFVPPSSDGILSLTEDTFYDLQEAIVGIQGTGRVLVDASHAGMAKVLVQSKDGGVQEFRVPLHRRSADMCRVLGYEVAMACAPEVLLLVDLHRLEQMRDPGESQHMTTLMRMMDDCASLGSTGHAAVAVDMDSLMMPFDEEQEQVGHAASGTGSGQSGSSNRTVVRQKGVHNKPMLYAMSATMGKTPAVHSTGAVVREAAAAAEADHSAAPCFCAVVAVTQSSYVADTLKKDMGFVLQGHRWDATYRGANVAVLGQEVKPVHTGDDWESIRTVHPFRGPSDMYVIQLQWNPSESKNYVVIGAVEESQVLGGKLQVGETTFSIGYNPKTQEVKRRGGKEIACSVNGIRPGARVGLRVANGNLQFFVQNNSGAWLGPTNVAGNLSGKWYPAVSFRGEKVSQVSARMLSSLPFAEVDHGARAATREARRAAQRGTFRTDDQEADGAAAGGGGGSPEDPQPATVRFLSQQGFELHDDGAVVRHTRCTKLWEGCVVDLRMCTGVGPTHSYYYEVEIVDTNDGDIAVGVLPGDKVSPTYLVDQGWTTKGGVCFEAYDRRFFSKNQRYPFHQLPDGSLRPSRCRADSKGLVVCVHVCMDTTSAHNGKIRFGFRENVGVGRVWMTTVSSNQGWLPLSSYVDAAPFYMPSVHMYRDRDRVRLHWVPNTNPRHPDSRVEAGGDGQAAGGGGGR